MIWSSTPDAAADVAAPILKEWPLNFKYIQARYSLGAKLTSPLFLDSEFGNSPMSRDHFISLLRQLL
jgi:hypothetical protein